MIGVVACSVAAVWWPAPAPRPSPIVTVSVVGSGPAQPVMLGGRPTVGNVLVASGVRLRPAHLLGAGRHEPLAGQDIAPTVLLNGVAVSLTAVVTGQGNVLHVEPEPDRVEAVVFRPATSIAPPPLPRVMRKLWHPGTPGQRGEMWLGAVSDELLNAPVSRPPTPPAPVTEKLVALTFDDGPWPDTAQFLAVLQAAGVKATFCMIGRQVLAHPAWVQAVAAAGMTVCNHTMNHDERLDRASVSTISSEIQGGANALVKVLGKAPSFYRPPGGTLSSLVEDAANALGEQVLYWSVDPSDYTRPGAAKIVAAVLAHVAPGAIIGLHDGGGDRSQTLAALPVIIEKLKAQGYSFTTPDAISPTRPAT